MDINSEEDFVCDEFIKAQVRDGRSFVFNLRPDRWPDYLIHDGQVEWGLELTTLDLSRHRKQTNQERDFWAAISERLGEWPNHLRGVRIMISGSLAHFPKSTSRRGRRYVSLILDSIRDAAALTDEVRTGIYRRMDLEIDGETVSLHLTHSQTALPQGLFFERSLHYSGNEPDLLLWSAIQRKINKGYDDRFALNLILIVYSINAVPITKESPGVALHAR